MTKNIYYASNSHSLNFHQNTRSSFRCQIDRNEFDYFEHQNIAAAIKSVTFQNTYNNYEAKFGTPNMILIQNFIDDVPLLRYEGKFPVPSQIDIKSGLDYYLFAKGEKMYGEGKNFLSRNFTDVKIFCDEMNVTMTSRFLSKTKNKYSSVVHAIYFHQATYQTDQELIEYLNHVFRNIEFDLGSQPDLQLEDDHLFEETFGHTLVHSKVLMNLDIFLSHELAKILGFIEGDLQKMPASNLRQLAEFNMGKKSSPMAVYDRSIKRFVDTFTVDEDIGFKTINPQAQQFLDLEFFRGQDFFAAGNQVTGFSQKSDYSTRSSGKIDLNSIFPSVIGLRTSLKNPDIFKEGSYDTQVDFINVRDAASGVFNFTAKNPSYFATTIEKICNAKFEIVDINTNTYPNFSLGSPTYIQLLVSNNVKMTKQFNVFLDSSDENSKHYYPSNSFQDFSIKLPERLQFSKDWTVALKNIFIGNDLFNIYEDSCWLRFSLLRGLGDGRNWPTNAKINYFPQSSIDTGEGKPINEDLISFKAQISLEDMKLNSVEELCDYIQTHFDRHNLQLKIWFENNRVRLKFNKTGRYLLKEFKLKFSPHLSNILGLSKGTQNISRLRFDMVDDYVATYQPLIALLVPTNFVILCNIVSESVFGDKSIRILRLLSTNFESDKDILHFSFYQDEPVDLHVKEFSTIRISILDATGNLIKATGTQPTRCQLLFSQNM